MNELTQWEKALRQRSLFVEEIYVEEDEPEPEPETSPDPGRAHGCAYVAMGLLYLLAGSVFVAIVALFLGPVIACWIGCAP